MVRIRFLVTLVCVIGASVAEKPCSSPLWTLDLSEKYNFRPFELARHPTNGLPERWKTQQGTVFISSDVLAVYQVLENEQPTSAGSRTESGGAGRFTLQVEFLDTRQGKEMRSLHLTTASADFSEVYPTHDGKFLVRTGEIMRLYSRGFEELASRPLPLARKAPNESWLVAVAPSGTRIYAHHNETFGFKEGAVDKQYVLDADSLQTISTADQDSLGHWPPEDSEVTWRREFPEGSIPKRDRVVSIRGSDSLVAGEIHRRSWNPLDLNVAPKALRILLYSLAKKSELCSIAITKPVHGWPSSYFYAVSAGGTVAVIQGGTLSFYQP